MPMPLIVCFVGRRRPCEVEILGMSWAGVHAWRWVFGIKVPPDGAATLTRGKRFETEWHVFWGKPWNPYILSSTSISQTFHPMLLPNRYPFGGFWDGDNPLLHGDHLLSPK